MTPRDPLDRGTAGPDWIATQIARAGNLNNAPPVAMLRPVARPDTLRPSEGDTAPQDRPMRPDDLARLAEYHAPREPMPAWAGWMWGAAFVLGAAVWAAIAWGIWG